MTGAVNMIGVVKRKESFSKIFIKGVAQDGSLQGIVVASGKEKGRRKADAFQKAPKERSVLMMEVVAAKFGAKCFERGTFT